MKDLWRIPFTIILCAIAAMAVGIFLHVGRRDLACLIFIWMWLFTGFMIGFIISIGDPIPFRNRTKIMVFWLPALWSEKIREWAAEK